MLKLLKTCSSIPPCTGKPKAPTMLRLASAMPEKDGAGIITGKMPEIQKIALYRFNNSRKVHKRPYISLDHSSQ